MVIVIDRACVAVVAVESVTLTVKGIGPPETSGFPEITPAPLKLRPLGRVPADTDHVYGAVPPVAARD